MSDRDWEKREFPSLNTVSYCAGGRDIEVDIDIKADDRTVDVEVMSYSEGTYIFPMPADIARDLAHSILRVLGNGDE